MTRQDPTMALAVDLSQSGVDLLACRADGVWESLAHVTFDSPTHAAEMLALHELAKATAGPDFHTRLWLPEDQVLIRSLRLNGETEAARADEVRGALVAMTPYRAEEICFDVAEQEVGGRFTVVAASIDTLNEAMEFARFHDLRPEFVSTRAETLGFVRPPVLRVHQNPVAAERKARRGMVAALAAAVVGGLAVLGMLWGGGDTETRPSDPVKIVGLSNAPIVMRSAQIASLAPQRPTGFVPPVYTVAPTDIGLPPTPDRTSADSRYLLFDLELVAVSAPLIPTRAAVSPLARPARIVTASLGRDTNVRPRSTDASDAPRTVVSTLVEPVFAAESWFVRSASIARIDVAALTAPLAAERSDQRPRAPRNIVQTISPAEIERVTDGFVPGDGIELANVEVAPVPSPRPESGTTLTEAVTTSQDDPVVAVVIGTPPLVPPRRPEPVMERPRPRPRLAGTDVETPQTEPSATPGEIVAALPDTTTASEPSVAPTAPADAVTPQTETTTAGVAPAPSSPIPSGTETPPTETATLVRPGSTVPDPAALANEAAADAPQAPTATEPEVAAVAIIVPAPARPVLEDTTDLALALPPDTPVVAPDVKSEPRPDVSPEATAPGTPQIEPPELAIRSPIEMARPAPRPDRFAPTRNAPPVAKRPQTRPDRPEVVVEPVDETPTAQAVAVALLAKPRPSDLAARAKRVRDAREKAAQTRRIATPAPAPAPATRPKRVTPATPTLPTTASVRKAATVRDAIDLSTISLIGIYGSPRSRRALIRMPSGSYVRVTRGDSVDGWKVAAVGDDSLRLARGGDSQVLRVPGK